MLKTKKIKLADAKEPLACGILKPKNKKKLEDIRS